MTAWFEDVPIGESHALGAHTFTAAEIVAYALRYDPQPFHIDEEAARASHFGGLCASGWHTAAVWMRLMVEFRQRQTADARAAGRPVASLGPSPGFRDLQWLLPVYAGDTIAYTTTVLDKRASASRPRWGLVHHRNTGTNQHGRPVFAFTAAVFWERRPDGAA